MLAWVLFFQPQLTREELPAVPASGVCHLVQDEGAKRADVVSHLCVRQAVKVTPVSIKIGTQFGMHV